MNNQIITSLNKARAEIAKEYEYHSVEASKRKMQIENLDKLIKEQYQQGYETRNSIDKSTLPQGELGYIPKRCIAYDKEVFRYSSKGEFITTYKNPDVAQGVIRVEENKPELECRSAIGYCCTGSYNIKNPSANHHKYKNRIFFDRKLTEDEISICFELGIFDR